MIKAGPGTRAPRQASEGLRATVTVREVTPRQCSKQNPSLAPVPAIRDVKVALVGGSGSFSQEVLVKGLAGAAAEAHGLRIWFRLRIRLQFQGRAAPKSGTDQQSSRNNVSGSWLVRRPLHTRCCSVESSGQPPRRKLASG